MFWVMLTWCCLGPWPGPETGAEGGWAAFWTGQRWGGQRHWPGCSGHPGTSPGSPSHSAASVLINTFCSDFLLPLASADRCDWVVSLLTDVAITRYMYRNPVCCSSDGRSTTDDDHWCHPPMAGTSCDRWQLLCQHWSLIGRQWPGDTNTGLLLAVTSLLWALYAAGELLTTAALHKTSSWLANSCIWGLWLAEGDKGTSAILETAACSDRGLCGDGLHLHPFYKR